jgi:hypothetical protein
MPVVTADSPTVSRDDWVLLALVDGQRTVGELVEVSGAGQFSVVSTLASLVQRGMLVLHDDDAPDHISVVRRRQQLLAPLETVANAVQLAAEPEPVVTAPAAPVPAVTVPVVTGPAYPLQPQQPAAAAAAAHTTDAVIGGAHDPINVVPPRPEPFMPKRVVEHPEPTRGGFAPPTAAPSMVAPAAPAGAAGRAATAAQPVGESAIERDPTVNRSLMLRLIAGVRGL